MSTSQNLKLRTSTATTLMVMGQAVTQVARLVTHWQMFHWQRGGQQISQQHWLRTWRWSCSVINNITEEMLEQVSKESAEFIDVTTFLWYTFDSLKKSVAGGLQVPYGTVWATVFQWHYYSGQRNSQTAPTLTHPTHGLQQLWEAAERTNKTCHLLA